jgi:DNA-binding transcriptional MerR regulator
MNVRRRRRLRPGGDRRMSSKARGANLAGEANKAAPEGRASFLKIGEVAKKSGVGIETLRFYEKQGLLGQPRRTSSGYRLYRPEVLDRLAFIKQAQVLGFTLAEIGRIISEKESGQSPCAKVREIVRARLKEIDERMREMQQYRDELAAALAEWDKAKDKEGHVCGLIESAHVEHSSPVSGGIKRGRK